MKIQNYGENILKYKLMELIEQEGDYKKFNHKGIKCEIKRQETMRHLCGYVYIPQDIQNYTEEDLDLYAHGGVTYHAVKDGYVVVGFDCAHGGDLVPEMFFRSGSVLGKYRDMKYVEEILMNMVDYVVDTMKLEENNE